MLLNQQKSNSKAPQTASKEALPPATALLLQIYGKNSTNEQDI